MQFIFTVEVERTCYKKGTLAVPIEAPDEYAAEIAFDRDALAGRLTAAMEQVLDAAPIHDHEDEIKDYIVWAGGPA